MTDDIEAEIEIERLRASAKQMQLGVEGLQQSEALRVPEVPSDPALPSVGEVSLFLCNISKIDDNSKVGDWGFKENDGDSSFTSNTSSQTDEEKEASAMNLSLFPSFSQNFGALLAATPKELGEENHMCWDEQLGRWVEHGQDDGEMSISGCPDKSGEGVANQEQLDRERRKDLGRSSPPQGQPYGEGREILRRRSCPTCLEPTHCKLSEPLVVTLLASSHDSAVELQRNASDPVFVASAGTAEENDASLGTTPSEQANREGERIAEFLEAISVTCQRVSVSDECEVGEGSKIASFLWMIGAETSQDEHDNIVLFLREIGAFLEPSQQEGDSGTPGEEACISEQGRDEATEAICQFLAFWTELDRVECSALCGGSTASTSEGLHCVEGHCLCSECAVRAINIWLHEPGRGKERMKCSFCEAWYTEADLAGAMTAQQKKAYERRLLDLEKEESLLGQISCPSCSVTSQSSLESLQSTELDSFTTCPSQDCGFIFCRLCKTARNELDENPGEHSSKCTHLYRLGLKFLSTVSDCAQMKCPQCGLKGIKDESCTHMSCDSCGCTWCYCCGLDEMECEHDEDYPIEDFYRHNMGWPRLNSRCPMYLHDISKV